MRLQELLAASTGAPPDTGLSGLGGGAAGGGVGPVCVDPRLVAAIAHALDGLYALAWGYKEQQRALGAAGACGPVAALLRSPGVLGDVGLLENSLRAVCVLCFCGAVSVETRDAENRLALGAAGACEGDFSVFLLIAFMTGLIALLPFYSVTY